MKVLCLNERFNQSHGSQGHPHPYIGDIDEVIYRFQFEGRWYLELKRFEGDAFTETSFSPLSDIDELELVNEKQLVNA